MAEKTGHDVEGLKWGEGTIANVKWFGTPVRRVLLNAGVSDKPDEWAGWHVWFASHDANEENEENNFSVSIPLAKAMEGSVIIAYGVWALL